MKIWVLGLASLVSVSVFSATFEPQWGREISIEQERERVDRWVSRYPEMANGHVDADGFHPQHTFFYPEEDYRFEHLEKLADLCRDGYGEIKSMFVDPNTRRAGVAAGLMASLEAETITHGLEMLRLETGNLLHAAQALYRRHGFTLRGPFGSYSEHPNSVFMEKRLT